MQDLKCLQESVEDYIMDPGNPDKAFDLADKYKKYGMTAAAISNYMVAIENGCSQEYVNDSLLNMGYLYFRQGDRLSEVRLMADYAKSVDPTDMRAYALKCLALERKALDNDSTTDKGFRLELWLGLLNEALTAINMPNREHEYTEEYYRGKEDFVFWYGEALLYIGLTDEAQERLNSVINDDSDQATRLKAMRLLYKYGLRIEFFEDDTIGQ